jgi:diadenosine tetraphosphatase ApaH/serine/threonine PP2A family protein phosphatase
LKAILSDVHGNHEAFEAVLADVRRQGIDTAYNLGDTLGYGPDPLACLELASAQRLTLLGNFDYAVLHGADGFGAAAERSILWTRKILQSGSGDALAPGPWRTWLEALPQAFRDAGALYVHGSPRRPLHEYLFPEEIYNPKKLTAIAAMFDGLCFCGHTHLPGVFLLDRPGKWDYLTPDECGSGFTVGGRKLICNVGSVGQPRDQDPRASYVVFDGVRVRFRRVEYDFEATIRKVHAIPEIDNFLGDRLREGR